MNARCSRLGADLGRDTPGRIILALTFLFLTVRASWGFDFNDGSYAVGLAMRLSHGDVPLRDELGIHSLAAVPAAGWTWVWTHTVGMTGVVLANRLFYVALAMASALVAWRAMRVVALPTSVAIGIASALFVLPYNLQVPSYNTLSGLLVLVATAALFPATIKGAHRWAAVAGAAGVGATVALPSLAVGFAVAGLLLLVTPTRGSTLPRAALLGGAGGATLVVLGYLSVVPGWSAVLAAKESGAAQLPEGGSVLAGAFATVAAYAEMASGSKLLGLAGVIALLACLPRMPTAVRALFVGVIPLLVMAWGDPPGLPNSEEPTAGSYSGVIATWLLLLLGPGVGLWAWKRVTQPTRLAALASVAVAVLGAMTIAQTTLSHPKHGAIGAALTGAVLLVATGATQLCRGGGARFVALGATSALCLVGSLVVIVFNEGPATSLASWSREGPTAGLLVGAQRAEEIRQVDAALAACTAPRSQGLLAVRQFGVNALFDGPAATDRMWHRDLGQSSVAWGLSRGHVPGCIVVPLNFGVEEDPVMSRFLTGYREVGRFTLTQSLYDTVAHEFRVMQRS